MNQKTAPFRKIHAECKKLKSLPNKVQEYTEDAQTTIIATTRSTIPKISSDHLFILLEETFNLKRLCLKNTYFEMVLNSFINGPLF
jgi:hypothetical protein